MLVPHEVERLIERFARNRRRPPGGPSRQAKPPLRGQYNEAMVRNEYIDPFFIALGWDVHNTAGYLRGRIPARREKPRAVITPSHRPRLPTSPRLRRTRRRAGIRPGFGPRPLGPPVAGLPASPKLRRTRCRGRHSSFTRHWVFRRSAPNSRPRGHSSFRRRRLDRQIDQLVYALYGLTEEEIRIVEEATQ